MYVDRKPLTIIRDRAPRPDPQALALAALGWIVEEPRRGERFLSLTGLTPDELRRGLTDLAVLAAVLDFLLGHEADLIAAADALDVAPDTFAQVREALVG